MIKFKNIFILLILSLNSFAQKSFDKKTLENFQNNNNDSVFITKNSDTPFHLETYTFGYDQDSSSNPILRDILYGKVGNVYGPFSSDTSDYYIKIISVDSAYKTNVGNIWIDIKRGREVALQSATRIFNEVKSGKDFDLYCTMYADDRNPKKNCEIGWSFNTDFVEPFASEVIKHSKGELFFVETIYGFHIVKTLNNPYKTRRKTTYIILNRKK